MREEGDSEDFKDDFLRMEAEVGFKMGEGRSQFSWLRDTLFFISQRYILK
jgi:hypothetical protein